MELMEDNGDPLEGWRSLVSSPKKGGMLLPSFVTEPFTSKQLPTYEGLGNGGLKNGDDSLMMMDVVDDNKSEEEEEENGGSGFGGNNVFSSSNVGKEKEKNGGNGGGGSILERRAAKFGFNASRINTARFRTTSPLASPAAASSSPCLTIPPGISPTTLLDSPIMLPNSQLSPTTGTFPLPSLNHEISRINSAAPFFTDGDSGSIVGSSFRFMPHGSHVSFPYSSGSENWGSSPCNLAQSLGADVDYQTLAPGQLPFDFEFPAGFMKEAPKPCPADSHTDVKVSSSATVNSNCVASQTCQSNDHHMPQQNEPIHGQDARVHHLLEGDHKGTNLSTGMARNSEDGYNWRKYGQKQVKGSEYPRSYYKCTHANCQVKKKVERSHDGEITEIIYKGSHNHPEPQPTRRSVLGSAFPSHEISEMGDGSESCVQIEGGSVWRNIQLGSKDYKVGSDGRADNLERTSSTSVVTELSDPMSTTQGKSMCVFETAETPELSSALASHDDEDGATQGSVSLGDDADGDESDSKRRKKENCFIETNMGSRAVREPRVVVQIETEVDILDDGYRWRKYGQKVVKGNPNPRSYYKCTSAGCPVRKHVERASNNLKCVIVTYEGKHNHEIPAARNSNHMNSGAGNFTSASTTAQPTMSLPRTINMPKIDAQVEDTAPQFRRKPEFDNEFLRPACLGNFRNDMKFGASSIYQMKFPTLQNSMPYCSFGLNPNHIGAHHAGLSASDLPGLPTSLPLSLPRSGNLALPGIKFESHGKASGPVQPFLAGQQQPNESDMRFIRPKQEQKDDNPYDAHLPIVDNASMTSSSSSAIYRQMMRSFPS